MNECQGLPEQPETCGRGYDEKPCCGNCKHWVFQFADDGLGYGSCESRDLRENIMVGNRNIKLDESWTFLGIEDAAAKALGLWVEFIPRESFYCNLHEWRDE